MGDILLSAVVVFCVDEALTLNAPKTIPALEAFLAAEPEPKDEWDDDPRRWVIRTEPLTNGFMTIVLAPSGSKLGWDTHGKWMDFRDRFITFAKTLPFANVIEVEDRYDSYPRWQIAKDNA